MATKENQLRLFLSACTETGDHTKKILAEMIKMENSRTNIIEDYRLIKKLNCQLVLWEGASSSDQLLMDAEARPMLEEFLLSLVMQENREVVWRKSDLVYLLVWAVEKEMQELAEQLILTESVSCMQKVRYGGEFKCAWDVVKLRSSSRPIQGVTDNVYQVLLKRMLIRLEVQTVLLERKQTLLNFANAILLVGALISGAAYQGWLQPPLGYSFEDGQGTGYANVAHSKLVGRFMTSNTIAFFLAVGSMIAGATTAIPAREHVNILELLKWVESIVVKASLMLSISVAFLMNSFWYAGFAIIDTPSAAISHGRATMHGFMIAGNVVCVSVFGIAFVRLLPLLLSPFFAKYPQFLKFCPVP